MEPRRLPAITGFLALTAALTVTAGWYALGGSVARLADRGEAETALAADRLAAQFLRYRQAAVFLADQARIKAALSPPPLQGTGLVPMLQRIAALTGTYDIHVLDASGGRLAASNSEGATAYAPGQEFVRAMTGALGLDQRVDPVTGRRMVHYAAPVFADTGPILGAVILSIDAAKIEAAWRGEAQTIYFTRPDGAIFISNRDELLLRVSGGAAQSGGFAPRSSLRVAGAEVWTLDEGPYIPSYALHLSRPMPVIGMTAETLVSLTPALRQALLVAAAAATLCIGLGAVLFALGERRRALAVRLAAEAAANARLEERVAARTRELSEANEQIRRAQADLVQAGKLSALGTMSAGISHELNQPLMAIQTYAGNAGVLLERGDTEAVRGNLGQIVEMSRRMARIIRNLRAFARQESAPVTTVDLVAVVDAALELSEAKLRAAGIAHGWSRPTAPVLVRGGEVRLQQVVLNLVSNAADAMLGSAQRVLSLSIRQEGDTFVLRVADTGPGIAEPERIFEPFYSTREVGQSEGVGLGLSISYGLVQSFGGRITGRNHPEGGAEFSVELQAAREARAA